MKCISSPALDDTQILSFMEGEADDTVVAHIQMCPFCSEKVRQWTRLQASLRGHLYRSSCPTPMELGDYQLGYLMAPQELSIAQHLRECPLCRREVATLEGFLNGPDRDSGVFETAKVLIAKLINASSEDGLARAAPALRGETKGPLTFEADGIVIVLDIQPAKEGTASIFGQVAADDQEQWTGALVELRQDSRLEFSAAVDDLGAFQLEILSPGSKELRIIPRNYSLIVISDFEVST